MPVQDAGIVSLLSVNFQFPCVRGEEVECFIFDYFPDWKAYVEPATFSKQLIREISTKPRNRPTQLGSKFSFT